MLDVTFLVSGCNKTHKGRKGRDGKVVGDPSQGHVTNSSLPQPLPTIASPLLFPSCQGDSPWNPFHSIPLLLLGHPHPPVTKQQNLATGKHQGKCPKFHI